MKYISFVIPVYNQCEELRECIEHIVPYKGDDIEIVVSDDGSDDGVSSMIESFNDSRIRLLYNDTRMGQDANILNGLAKSEGHFCFLLRTKDYVIWKKIPDIIRVIKNNPNVVYITGSSIDEKGEPKITYEKNELVRRGAEALRRHYQLYDHPSGCLYKRELLDVLGYENFLKNTVDGRHYIYLSVLMRLSLSQKGDFYLMKEVIWIYTNTTKAKNKSANVGRKFIFDPEYMSMSYSGEVLWIKDMEMEDKEKLYAYLREFGRYLPAHTWAYYYLINNDEVRSHYQIEYKQVNIKCERNKFLDVVAKMEKIVGINGNMEYQREKGRYLEKNMEYCNEQGIE